MARDREERFPTPVAFDDALAPFVSGPTSSGGASGESIEQLSWTARASRPTIALASVRGGLFLASGIADVLTAVFASSDVAPAGARLAVVGTVAALATPAWLYVRFLREQVWNNSPRAAALAQRLVVHVGVGAGAYGAFLALERLLDLLVGDGLGPSSAVRATIWALSLALALAAPIHPAMT